MHIGLAVCAALLLATLGFSGAVAQDKRWGQSYLPNVPVVTQHGQSLRFYDDVLKGKIAIVSFIYTSCQDICPVVTARLSQVEDKLGDIVGRDTFFVSISVDPETDTPAKLKEHADAFRIGGSWLFLTGNKQDIDLIRHKLGDRGKKLSEHRNEILLYNDATGEWARDSIFGDMNVLTTTIRRMDPSWRPEATAAAPTTETAALPSTDLPGQALFIRTCASCHTVGQGERVGPDLFGLLARRERPWVVDYLLGPERMFARRDPIAVELRAKYKAVRMPNLGLAENDAADLLAYLEAQSHVHAVKRSQTSAGGAAQTPHHAH